LELGFLGKRADTWFKDGDAMRVLKRMLPSKRDEEVDGEYILGRLGWISDPPAAGGLMGSERSQPT